MQQLYTKYFKARMQGQRRVEAAIDKHITTLLNLDNLRTCQAALKSGSELDKYAWAKQLENTKMNGLTGLLGLLTEQAADLRTIINVQHIDIYGEPALFLKAE